MQIVKSEYNINTTVVKGIYILLVVLGHNVITQEISPEISKFLYDFHVFGFFFLPFLFTAKKLSKENIVTYAIRYLVPYIIFCMLFMIVANIFTRNTINESSISSFIISIFTGSAHLLKKTVGIQLLWFLPSLFSLIIIRMMYESCPSIGKRILFGLMAILHFTIGLLPSYVTEYLPLGFGPVSFVLVLGFMLEYLNRTAFLKKSTIILAVISWPILSYIAYYENSHINLGTMRLPSIFNLRMMIVHDGIIISSFVFIVRISSLLCKSEFLNLTGKYSLEIYLTHTLIFYFLYNLIKNIELIFPGNIIITPEIKVLITYSLTVALALAVSHIINRYKIIRKSLLPRNKDEFFISI